MIRPLCASITPFEDESLISLIGRAAVVNEMTSLGKLLQFADVAAKNPAFTAFTQRSASGNIASLLGLDKSAIERRMHPRIEELDSPIVDWFGTPLERRFIEVKGRRYSPSGLLDGAYGRSLWMIKPLHYCPLSLDLLCHCCPSCKKTLGWVRTHGLARCESCRATLDTDSVKLDPALAAEAVQIGNLLHRTSAVRDAELIQLPQPFDSWKAGEVFAAVVDLGVIAANPLSAHNHPLGKQTASGDFTALGPNGIFLGWRMVQGWPAPLVSVVETILSANFGKGGENFASLGPLARHLNPAARPTKLRNLLRATIPLVDSRLSNFNRAGVRLEKRSALADAMTTSEAIKLLGVSWSTMRRLKHRGKRVAAYAQPKSSVRLFDRELIQNMIKLRATALEYGQAAECLGVPVHVIPYLRDRGLLSPVKGNDVLVLAGTEELISRDSIDELLKGVLRVSISNRNVETISLERGLRHQLNPSVWIGVIEQMLSGKLLAFRVDVGEPLAKAVHVDALQLRRLIADLDVRPNVDRSVQLSEASPLMRVSYPVLSKAAALGMVKRLGGGLSLWSLLDFQSRYVFPAEVADRYSGGCRVFCNTMRAGGAKSAKLCRVNLWERRDVARIFPESFKAEYRAS